MNKNITRETNKNRFKKLTIFGNITMLYSITRFGSEKESMKYKMKLLLSLSSILNYNSTKKKCFFSIIMN